MLYVHLIKQYQTQVRDAVRELFANAYRNQKNEYDLLLVLENGMYDKQIEEANKNNHKSKWLNPYIIGPHYQHYAEQTQYDFFHTYRTTNLKNVNQQNNLQRVKGNLQLEHAYSVGTQIEMVLYLKLFEANRFLERLYKLVQLCNGKEYPWKFEITKDDSRQKLIREEIRDASKNASPKFYNLIKEIYLSQIRNAVAHSQFFILGVDINFLNYDPKRHSPLYFVKIEDWETRFHKLVLFYNEFMHCQSMYNYIYFREARGKHFGLPLNGFNSLHKRITCWYRYNLELDRWQMYTSWRSTLKVFTIV